MADMIEPIAGEPEAPDGGSFQCEVEFIDNNKNTIHYETYTIDDTYNGFPSWLLNKTFMYKDKRYGNWTHYVGKESYAKPLSETINEDLRSLLWYNSTKDVYKVSLICTPPIASPMLTYEGLKVLWSQIALEDYPNNETLAAILNAIDSTKADKEELFGGSWNDLTDKPFGDVTTGYKQIYSTSGFPGSATISIGSSLPSGQYKVILNNVTYEFYLGATTTQVGSAQGFPFTLRRQQTGQNSYTWLFQGGDRTTANNSVTIHQALTSTILLEEKYIPTTIARTADLAGKAIANGGEIFNNYTNNTATGEGSHAEGWYTKADGEKSHAEGWYSESAGMVSHAEGYSTKASASYAHSEGYQSEATSSAAHAEGHDTEASGQGSHSEGGKTKATGTAAHAEGYESEATAQAAHAEGYITKATGDFSHAEGRETSVSGEAAHVEGMGSVASGQGAHAEGICTIAAGYGQHTEGRFNIEDSSDKYLHITGNGISGSNRSNAYTLDENGNAWYSGDVYVGSTSGKNQDEGSKKLATEEYVNLKEYDYLILKSSTPGSVKKFKLTIDDDGILASEEVNENE